MMGSRIYKCEVPQVLGDEMVAEALRQLPPWRLERALAYKRPLDRWLCAEAYLLLREALCEEFGLEGDFNFVYGPHGKPELEGHPEVHFNLSHCSSCVCCVVGHSPVGIDVEDIQFDEALAQSVMSPDELASIAAAARPDVEFTTLWTMKESLLKLSGEGLRDDLKEILVGESASRFEIEKNTEHGYVLCSVHV